MQLFTLAPITTYKYWNQAITFKITVYFSSGSHGPELCTCLCVIKCFKGVCCRGFIVMKFRSFVSDRWLLAVLVLIWRLNPRSAATLETEITSGTSAKERKLSTADVEMSSAQYWKKKKNLLEAAKDLRLWQKFVFLQDTDHKHAAAGTIEGFGSKDTHVPEWPSQSPDPRESVAWKSLSYFALEIHFYIC